MVPCLKFVFKKGVSYQELILLL